MACRSSRRKYRHTRRLRLESLERRELLEGMMGTGCIHTPMLLAEREIPGQTDYLFIFSEEAESSAVNDRDFRPVRGRQPLTPYSVLSLADILAQLASDDE